MRRSVSSLRQFSSPLETFVCASCRRQQLPLRNTFPSVQRRRYAISAAAPAEAPIEASTLQSTPQVTADAPQPQYMIRAGVLLSRPPLLTAPPTSFESAYYFYQRRLNERLVLPFSQYFYYKRGTPAYEEWKSRRRERGWAATRDIGTYDAYSKEAWNDEVLVGDKQSDPENVIRKLVEEEGREKFPAQEEASDTSKPMHGLRRITEADRKKDTRSLERALSRTLYLVVKKQKSGAKAGEGFWQFPSGALEGSEGLREAADRALQLSCGPNMNTWFVANHPVGHFVFEKGAEKTFFLKSRILAGQADVKGAGAKAAAANNATAATNKESMGVLDFQWLTKDEVEGVVAPQYWKQVKNMLAER